MGRPTLSDAIEAWATQYAGVPQDEIDRRVRLQAQVMRELTVGEPLSRETFAEISGLPLEGVPEIFDRLEAMGVQFDGERRLIGLVLALGETPHRFRVRGKPLYAWCSLDTLFLPGLLGESAEVESTCPVSGEAIRLSLAPEGVRRYEPSDTVLSVVLPGLSCSGDKTGPESSMCSQMFFFRSRDEAEIWAKDRPGLAILTVGEAERLARVHWVERTERAFAAAPLASEPAASTLRD